MGGPINPGLQRGDLPFHDIREFGSIETSDHTALLNTAAAQIPIGSTLFLPLHTYVLTGTGQLINITRKFSILGDGAVIRADVTDSVTDILYVHVTDAGGFGDVRGMKINGVAAFFNGSPGRHCILVHAEGGGALPQSGIEVSHCSFSSGAGAAIFVAGAVHSARIFDCDSISGGIEFGSYSGSSVPGDAHRVHRNLISGNRTGIILRAQFGSYSHTIKDNVIVSRDGAIYSTASQVKIRDNQIEQVGVNGSAYNASVVIAGDDYAVESWEVTGNNFGGGSNVGTNIVVVNGAHGLIEGNAFNETAGGVDINFASSGSSYNRVGYNSTRGTRGVFKPINLLVADNGEGNYGIWRFISSFGLSNSWLSDGLFYKSVDGKVSIEATLTAGVTTAGTLMFTLPVGARPIDAMRVGVETSSGAGHVLIGTNGQVTVGSLPSNTVYFNGFTFLAWHEV